MKRITNIGNLPNHLQLFAKQLGGVLSECDTEFYEINYINEFEKKAVEIGYEIVPAVDTSTGRGFLTGFSAEEPKDIITLVSYVKLKIYFVECTRQEIEEWTLKIREHRDMQQDNSIERRIKNQKEKNKKNPLIIK